MSIYRGVSNANREIQEQWRCVDGVNRRIKEQWCGAGGVNRQVYGNSPTTPNQDYICDFSASNMYAEFRDDREYIYLSSYYSSAQQNKSSVSFIFANKGLPIYSSNINIKLSNINVNIAGGSSSIFPCFEIAFQEYKQGNTAVYEQTYYYSFEKNVVNESFEISIKDFKLFYENPSLSYLTVSAITDRKGAILGEISNFNVQIGLTTLDFYSAK